MTKRKLLYLLFAVTALWSCNDDDSKNKGVKWNMKEKDTLAYFDNIHLCTELLPDSQYYNDVTKIDTNRFINTSGEVDTIIQYNGEQMYKEEAVILNAYIWNIKTLKVKFLDGEPATIDKVIKSAKQWQNHCNIRFDFGNHDAPDITISFKQRGSWSYIGSYSKKMSPSMNLGWFNSTTPESEIDRVVLHEFGHAIGLVHEHLSPKAAIDWNTQKVYQYYMGPPNKWDKATVDRNIFTKYNLSQVNASEFDSLSIMLYEIPKELTNNGYSTKSNYKLSAGDIEFIKKYY
jgi:hypothetical protein